MMPADPAATEQAIMAGEARMVLETPPELWPAFDAKNDLATVVAVWADKMLGPAVDQLGSAMMFELAAMWLRSHAQVFDDARQALDANDDPAEAEPSQRDERDAPTVQEGCDRNGFYRGTGTQ